MRDRLLCHIFRYMFLLLFIPGINNNILLGQEQIHGVINAYAKVTNIGAGYVDVDQAGSFSVGDYVLLVQMQGVGIQTDPYGLYVQSRLGTPGGYELLVVNSVNTGTGRITFTRNVYNNSYGYDVRGNLQLIRVPFYNSPTVTATLTSQEWNSTSGTGGVLAMLVGGKLTLNADIDVSGLGFKGAAGTDGIGECVRTNEAVNGLDSYPLTWLNAGLKGEGIAIHDELGNLLYPEHAKGQGGNFSGGGGGNGMYSGGGGGSNRGDGGNGGIEMYAACENDPREGGYGGMTITGTIVEDGLFAGGGGGASTQAPGSIASAGGNGGGIVIIITDTIEANNHFIRSNGNTASNAVSFAGSGGGGAGGSVAVSCQRFSGGLQLSANGGNGGTSTNGSGNGGGGGGGLIWLSSSSAPENVTSMSVTGGTLRSTNIEDGIGDVYFNYIPSLNGFLFNSIWSATTGNQVDSVCSNIRYGKIKGTSPVGGVAPYTFLWQRSTTSASGGFTAAEGTNNLQDYTPPSLLTQTSWFRRVVTDNSGTITDYSLPVMIVVHQNIKNNITGDAATICYGQNAPLQHSLSALGDGNGFYSFSWQESSDNIAFITTAGTAENYQPAAALTVTTWYRRLVSSGACADTSAPVRVEVLDSIRNNRILTPSQEICQGMTFADLSGTIPATLSGGDNTFRFRWENSANGSDWTVANGINNVGGYNPDESSAYFPGQQYFRRIVYSGTGNVCVNTSSPVILKEFSPVTNNLISPEEQTVCSGTSLIRLTGSLPENGKGPGTYTYTWQDSSAAHSWTDIPDYIRVAGQDFVTYILTDTTSYKRIVYSSACINTSNTIIINVHKPVTGNTISLSAGGLTDTTICYGSVPHRLTGAIPAGGTGIQGDFACQWSSSSDNATWNDISGAVANGFQPGALTATTWFRRRVISGECSSESGPVKITVLPLITGNTVTGGKTICKGSIPERLTQDPGVILSGGAGNGSYSYLWEESRDGTIWTPATGINNASDGNFQPPVMTRAMKYRRIISSGPNSCCSGISNIVSLAFDSLPPGTTINAGNDTIFYSFDYDFQLTAAPPETGGSGSWTLAEGTGSFIDDTDNNTVVQGLSKGLNRFLWTVTRGACKLEDMVEVYVYDMSIPEGFSPNDDPDNYNNSFIIKGLDLDNQIAELRIVNSAGTEVFFTSNRNGNEWEEWKGTNSKGKDLPEGTYYYLLKITSRQNGKLFKKSGFVILKRY